MKNIAKQRNNHLIQKIPKTLSLKGAFTLMLCAILFTSFFSYIVFSNPDLSYTTILQDGSMVTEADYVFSVESSTYYSRHGRSGAVLSSTNFSYLMEYSIDALPTTSTQSGGLLYITSGVYEVTHTINLDRTNVNIEGADRDNTKLSLADNADCSMFSIKPASLKNFISIRKLTLWGNKANQGAESSGVDVSGNVGDLNFEDLYIDNFYTQGIYLLPIVRIWNVWITDNLIEGCDGSGIYIFPHSAWTDFIHIKGNYLHGNQIGLRIAGNYSRCITVQGNHIKRNLNAGVLLEGARYVNIVGGNHICDNSEDTAYTYDGIYLGAYLGSVECHYITINDNTIANEGLTGYQRYGIAIQDTSDTLEIIGNQIVNNNNGSVYINAGAGTSSEIHYNIGLRTEYFGTSTISASTSVIQDHYLAGTPISVVVTPQSDINCTFWVTSCNSENFTINIALSQTVTFFWEALYRPT